MRPVDNDHTVPREQQVVGSDTHVSAVMHEFIGEHRDWLTVVQLPAFAPDLNPVEGLWANTKNGLGNLAACTAISWPR